MFHLTRRTLLKILSVVAGAGPAVVRTPAAADDDNARARDAAIRAMADAMLPADQDPGAVAAGLDVALAVSVHGDAKMRELYGTALDTLYIRAGVADGKAFAALPVEQRVALLETLPDIRTPPGRTGRIVYNHARRFVMERYYASPAGQAAVGYRPPAAGYPLPADDRSA